jgi:hypothetical protein
MAQLDIMTTNPTLPRATRLAHTLLISPIRLILESIVIVLKRLITVEMLRLVQASLVQVLLVHTVQAGTMIISLEPPQRHKPQLTHPQRLLAHTVQILLTKPILVWTVIVQRRRIAITAEMLL